MLTGAKLAPIFEKRSTAKVKKSPVLSAAEIEARRIRREFLISGVPEELKRQQEASQALAFCPVPAVWPKDSHIQQRLSSFQKDFDPWNLPEAQLPLRSCNHLGVSPKSSGNGCVLLGGLPAIADRHTSNQVMIKLMAVCLVFIVAEMFALLLLAFKQMERLKRIWKEMKGFVHGQFGTVASMASCRSICCFPEYLYAMNN